MCACVSVCACVFAYVSKIVRVALCYSLYARQYSGYNAVCGCTFKGIVHGCTLCGTFVAAHYVAHFVAAHCVAQFVAAHFKA